MSDADKAYEVARRLIAEAKAEGSRSLILNHPGTRALTRLPPEIADLDTLFSFDLGNNEVADLSPISGLTGLTELRLNRTGVTDLSPIFGLTGLTTLLLNGTGVTGLSPLSGLTGLTTLGLGGTGVTDLSPLSRLTGLTWLSLNSTGVTDLSPLSGLTGLTTLRLDGTGVTDLSPLSGLTGLTTLDLDNSAALDLRPLRGLEALTRKPGNSPIWGLTFKNSAAARADPRIAEIAGIEDHAERARTLFDFLEDWVPPGVEDEIERALAGPILADSIADLRRDGDRFQAVASEDEASAPRDRHHDELIATLSYAGRRLGATEAGNRIGQETAQSLRDYAQFVSQDPPNARLLMFLAEGLRGVLSDTIQVESLDAFDLASLTEFLGAHDELIRAYYARSSATPSRIAEADVETIQRELFPKLRSAKEMIAEADERGLFAPSVSNALEMLERRAEGARRGIVTSTDPAARERAETDLRRTFVLVTAYLGRIKGRVQQWLNAQAEHVLDNPTSTAANTATLYLAAQQLVAHVTPLFQDLWRLVGNLPLPF